METEGELQRKYEGAVSELRTAQEEHRRQLHASERRTEAALSEMHQLDSLIAGEFLVSVWLFLALVGDLALIFSFLLESWPGTQETAEKAVQEYRQLLRQEGIVVEESDV